MEKIQEFKDYLIELLKKYMPSGEGIVVYKISKWVEENTTILPTFYENKSKEITNSPLVQVLFFCIS